MKQNWKRNLIGGLSLTSMLFIFQACYGTPQDLKDDILIEGIVKSGTTGNAIKGIKISVLNFSQYCYSDDAGKFSFYTIPDTSIGLRFEDVDSTQNGAFYAKDTILKNPPPQVYVTMTLDEK
jgi:hypothetical protein